MKSAVVSGAGGFVGSRLVNELAGHGVTVYALTRSAKPNYHYLPGVETVVLDMANYDSLSWMLKGAKPEVFYHLAWDGVSGALRSNVASQLKNVAGATNAVEAAGALGCGRFIGMGSIVEAEAQAAVSIDGNQPSCGYIAGAAKFFAHCATKTRCAELKIAHIWPMLTNAYGEGEISPRFINTTLRKIFTDEPLEFTDGSQLYDFIHVSDAARALRLLGDTGQPFSSYVIGSGNPRPLRDYVETLVKELAPGRELLFGNLPYTGAQLSPDAFNTAQLLKDTGFQAEISFAEGLRRTFDWMVESNNA